MKTIDLKDYELSGGGKLGESYIKKDDPDILLGSLANIGSAYLVLIGGKCRRVV